jgi:hypothetical protein
VLDETQQQQQRHLQNLLEFQMKKKAIVEEMRVEK